MATFNAGAIEATLDLDVDPFQRGIAVARAQGRDFARERFTAKLDLDDRYARLEAARLRRELERMARSYTINLEVDGLTDSSAQVQALEGQLHALGRHDHEVHVDTRGASASIGNMRRGIMAILPALAILSTGLIPLTAAAVPILGLLNNLTLTAAGAGTLMLAFQGVGDAMKTANEAAINPTAENLTKAHAAMSKLTPEAQAFVTQLRDMSGVAGQLRDAAAEGFMPGGTAALEDLQRILPGYTGLVRELSDAMGDNVAAAAQALGTKRWQTFTNFLEREARPGIDATMQSAGNLAGGLAGLWMAFDPLNDDFSGWLVDVTQRFETWANALDRTEGWRDFVAYVRESGPEAAETLSAIGSAFVDVVQAAAPLGGVVLDVLEHVADAIGFIADSPFGQELIIGAAALYTLNRALGMTAGLLTRMGVVQQGTTGKGLFGAIGTGARAQAQGLGVLRADLRSMRAEYGRLNGAQAVFRSGLSGTTAAAQRTRTTVAQYGRTAAAGAAGVAAIALASSEAGENMGMTNTAMMGLMGSMAGPWGAAVGAGVGLMMDFAAANNEVEAAVKGVDTAIASADFSALSSSVATIRKELKDSTDITGVGDLFDRIRDDVAAGFSGNFDRQGNLAKDLEAAEDKAIRFERAVSQIGLAMDDSFGKNNLGQSVVPSLRDLDAVARSAAPAMEALGYTWEELAKLDPSGQRAAAREIQRWTVHADSAAGRTDAFASSVADLANEALSTADSAAAMNTALEALLSPTLNLEQATDDWRVALAELRNGLNDSVGFEGFGKRVLENKQITRDYVTTSMERLKALAGVSTTTEKDMAAAVAETRQEFIRSGIAAGFSKKEIQARARELGLTPKMVRTVFEAAGITESMLEARELRDTFRSLPKNVRTRLQAEGIPKTVAEVDKLVKKYDLSEKDRQALLTVKDLATKDMEKVLAKLGLIDRTNPNPRIDVNAGNAQAIMDRVARTLANIDGTRAYTEIVTNYRVVRSSSDATPRRGQADGGVWQNGHLTFADGGFGSDGRYYTRDPRIIAGGANITWGEKETGWEAYISGKPSQRERNVAILSEAAARLGVAVTEFSRGGFSGPKAPRRVGAPTWPTPAQASVGLTSADVDRIVEAIERNRGVYAAVSSREDLEAAMRALEGELRRG